MPLIHDGVGARHDLAQLSVLAFVSASTERRQVAEREPYVRDNAPGNFYVDAELCLAHECCHDDAPEHFTLGEEESKKGYAWVHRQPRDAAEHLRCIVALMGCPVAAIGCGGTPGLPGPTRWLVVRDLDDDRSALNGQRVGHFLVLAAILEWAQTQTPRLLQFRAPDGSDIVVGIAGGVGCIQHTEGDLRSSLALAPGAVQVQGDVEFLAGGTPTPIAGRNCMPVPLLQKAAIHFLGTGAMTPALDWEWV